MVLDAYGHALLNLTTSPELWLFMSAGVILGLFVGLIPGIGPSVAVAVLLPFVFRMTPEQALPLLMAMLAVVCTAGSITAVLLNIPGEVANTPTMIDGYPMTQKGEGGRALGAALTGSTAGNFITALVALAFVPLVLPMVMALRSADMVFIILMGICFIAVLGSGSVIKTLISGGLGLLLAFVGYQAATGVPRFTFGNLYLAEGLNLVPVMMGIFAIPTMVQLAVGGGTIATPGATVKGIKGLLRGSKDVFVHRWLALQCSVIGFIIGAIPGPGATAASFVCYGWAKKRSKHPEEFGTGCVEGVIGPEVANNAEQAGAALTSLALGIPGSSSWALVLAAIMLVGLIPGPEMLTTHLELSLTLMLIILVAGVIAQVICFTLMGYLAKVATIPGRIVVPVVLVIIGVGVYAARQDINDVITLLVCGGMGIIIGNFGYSAPALALGFVLGELFERYFFISLGVAGPLFFMRPISLGIIAIMLVLFGFGPVKRLLQRKRRVGAV